MTSPTQFVPADIALTLLIGLGPIKSLLVFIAATNGQTSKTKRRIALRVVTVAGAVAAGLFVLGKALQSLLHFSDAAITIAGGLILLLLALKMVLGGSGGGAPTGPMTEAELDSLSIFPLALPLTLNPIGIVALIDLSNTTHEVADWFVVVAILVGVLVLDFLVFVLVGRRKHPNPQFVSVLEIVLGILLSALALELIIVGTRAAFGLAGGPH